MLNNVKDFGATGDGVSDDRAAIQAAIDEAVAQHKAGILVPAGTYRVSRSAAPGHRWSLDLNGTADFMVMGEGPSSVVKLVDTAAPTGDWHVFILRNTCRRIVFTDLVVDGNRSGLTNPDQQSHGIEVEGGTDDLVISRCILRDCFGDGIRLLGHEAASGGQHVQRLRIEACLFQGNKRSGLGIQRAVNQIMITGCMFDATVSDQSIDVEPSGADAPTELVIHGCLINHINRSAAVTLTGIRGADPLLRCKFADNVVLGGGVFCVDVAQLSIQNNVVLVTELGAGQRIPVHVQRGGDSILITGNLLINDDAAIREVIKLSEVNQRPVTRALIAENLCVARVGRGISLHSCDDVTLQSNMLVATGACVQGIFVESETSNVDGIAVRDNDIATKEGGTWHTGIQINAKAPHQVHQVSIVGNAVRGAAEGISFTGPGFRRTPVCALNRIDAGVGVPLVGLRSLPEDSLVVAGAVSRGGDSAESGAGRCLAGLGDPNNLVTGNVGDIFQRIDGTSGATLYVKEAGNGTTSGWTAK